MKKIIKTTINFCLLIALALCVLGGCGAKEEKVSGTVRVGALKGPTSLGLLMMNKGIEGSSDVVYDITMCTAADELLPQIIKGDLDIALVPANVASVLYNKTEGNVSVIDVNTLGVLYFVSGSDKYKTVNDLRGATIYLTGKGTTPDFVLQYMLKQSGIELSEVTLEYKSEATEVAAVLADNPEALGLLPQPFVTSALMQNDKLSVVLDLDELFLAASHSHITTGVTVVRNDFLKENKALVDAFVLDHAFSVNAVNKDVDTAAGLAEEAGIIPKAAIAKKAIPSCSISCIPGIDMKNMLSAYLQILYDFDKSAVGGALPGEDFYYMP